MESPATGVQQELAARGGVAAVEPPPDEAGVRTIQNGEPTSVEASLDTGAGTNEEASAGFPCRDASPRHQPSRPTTTSISRKFVNAACAGRSRSLADILAHEPADRAQYHHQDGTEAATMVELRTP
jgi:hypothetical protein